MDFKKSLIYLSFSIIIIDKERVFRLSKVLGLEKVTRFFLRL